jgi:hypothetical protein
MQRWKKRTRGRNEKFTNSGLIAHILKGYIERSSKKLTSSVFGDVEVKGIVVMIVR